MKYLFVFNPRAKRYHREAEAMILAQASRILPGAEITAVHTVPQPDGHAGAYGVADFARRSREAAGVTAVGGRGTINIVDNALMRSGWSRHAPRSVIPHGSGTNFVDSYGLQP